MNLVKAYLTQAQTPDKPPEEREHLAAMFDEAHELQEKLMELTGSRLSRNPPEPQ